MKASKLIDELSEAKPVHRPLSNIKPLPAHRGDLEDRASSKFGGVTSHSVNSGTEWESKEEFIDYLENTLIPDLKESDHVATAEDFETAVGFMRDGDLRRVRHGYV